MNDVVCDLNHLPFVVEAEQEAPLAQPLLGTTTGRQRVQQSVVRHTTHSETGYITLPDAWMRHFFTTDVSPTNRPVIELQWRACWIGLALILQAINEIPHQLYFPFLQSFASLIPLVLLVGSFVAMWLAFRPAPYVQAWPKPARRWQRTLLVLTLSITLVGGFELGRTVVMCFLPPQLANDGTSLDTNAAVLLLQGRNPYADSNILDVARRFPIQPSWTTPLRRGQFAHLIDYPTPSDFQTVLDTDLKSTSNDAPEFESKVSYPALSFLTLVPFVLVKDYNVLPFYFLSYLLLVLIAWKVACPELRPWILLLSMANVPMWTSTTGANLDIFCMLLIVLAWLQQQHRWRSAIFLGLAIASKQIAWFLVPFYIIMLWQHYGLKDVLYRLVVAGSIGLAINLPFILWDAHAWLSGILAPISDPMFPLGIGLVNLSVTHLLPFFPNWVYLSLEAGTMLLALFWFWRLCPHRPEAAMLLAVVPLFFAWRSLPSYFYCAAFPLFILMAAKTRQLDRHKQHYVLDSSPSSWYNRHET
jgi:hypothetical protein